MVFRVGQIRIGDVICYEVGFDGLVSSEVAAGANLLTVQTNDADFELDGQTGETLQQLAMARIRAVEHDRAVVVASTTGVSAVIAPDGRLIASTGPVAAGRDRGPGAAERPARPSPTGSAAGPRCVLTGATLAALAWAHLGRGHRGSAGGGPARPRAAAARGCPRRGSRAGLTPWRPNDPVAGNDPVASDRRNGSHNGSVLQSGAVQRPGAGSGSQRGRPCCWPAACPCSPSRTPNLELLAWVGLVPGLLLMAVAPRRREAAVRGCWFGTGYLLAAMYWLAPNLGPGLLLVAIVLGALFGGVGLAARVTLTPPVTPGRRRRR